MAPPSKDHGPQIKNDATYEALRKKGESKEKAARIANAQAKTDNASSAKGGRHGRYEDWTRDDLYDKAKQIGIDGRSRMNKDQLIDALRNH
ncbi:MAG: Rho termination factor [Rhodospirillaceae bacterium BRH_c57]|nr:MAG: Rho termination factor [Rhodospirillaceae bacterium BRH_c57]